MPRAGVPELRRRSPRTAAGLDAELSQACVEQPAGACAGLAVHDLDVGARQVFDAANGFGISVRGDDSFFPNRERDHRDRLLRKAAADLGEVGFAAAFVPKVRPGDVRQPSFEKLEGSRAVAMREHQLDSGRLHVAREHRDGGIATRDQQPVSEIIAGVQTLHFRGPAITASLGGKYHGAGEGGDATSCRSTRQSCTGWPGCSRPEPGSSLTRSARSSGAGRSSGSEKSSSTFTSSTRASFNASAVFGT